VAGLVLLAGGLTAAANESGWDTQTFQSRDFSAGRICRDVIRGDHKERQCWDPNDPNEAEWARSLDSTFLSAMGITRGHAPAKGPQGSAAIDALFVTLSSETRWNLALIGFCLIIGTILVVSIQWERKR
jgi:hypothetical protein